MGCYASRDTVTRINVPFESSRSELSASSRSEDRPEPPASDPLPSSVDPLTKPLCSGSHWAENGSPKNIRRKAIVSLHATTDKSIPRALIPRFRHGALSSPEYRSDGFERILRLVPCLNFKLLGRLLNSMYRYGQTYRMSTQCILRAQRMMMCILLASPSIVTADNITVLAIVCSYMQWQLTDHAEDDQEMLQRMQDSPFQQWLLSSGMWWFYEGSLQGYSRQELLSCYHDMLDLFDWHVYQDIQTPLCLVGAVLMADETPAGDYWQRLVTQSCIQVIMTNDGNYDKIHRAIDILCADPMLFLQRMRGATLRKCGSEYDLPELFDHHDSLPGQLSDRSPSLSDSKQDSDSKHNLDSTINVVQRSAAAFAEVDGHEWLASFGDCSSNRVGDAGPIHLPVATQKHGEEHAFP